MGFSDFMREAGTAVHDAVAMATDGKTYGQQERDKAAKQAQQAAHQAHNEQQRLAADNRAVQFNGDFDPASITQCENWAAYSHKFLYDTNQRSIQESSAVEVANAWRGIADDLQKIGPALQQDVGKALQDGWEGEAADAAKQAGEPLAQWAQQHGEALHLTGNRIEEAASAAGQVKGSVPPPQDISVGQKIATALMQPGPSPYDRFQHDGAAQMQQRQEAERQAQQTMGRVMTPAYQQADASTPSFQHVDGQHAPPAPVAEPPAPGLPPSPGHHAAGGASGSGGRAAAHHGVGGAGGAGGAGDGHHLGPGGVPAGTRAASSDGHPGPGQPGGPPPAGGQGGAVDGMLPIPPGAGMAGAGGAAAAGGARGGFGKGAAGGAGGGAAKGAGGAAESKGGAAGGGRSGAGAEEGAAGAGKAGASGRSASGGAGAGGMGPGGRGGDDENEHGRPTWLEEHDDVWLNDMPRTAPPVFGA
jgi:hypothetical protein